MRVFAYCCESFEESTRRAAGVDPLCSPPVSAEMFDSSWLEGYDLLYFDLHGQPRQSFWRGNGDTVALTAPLVRRADLTGAVVFALSCYLADEDSPMMEALLDAGARYVIGGDGQNYGAARSPRWAGLLGLWFRRLMGWGADPLVALKLAKDRVRLKAVKDKVISKKRPKGLFQVSEAEAVADTLAFRAYYRR